MDLMVTVKNFLQVLQQNITRVLNPELDKKLEQLRCKEGAGTTPTSVTFSPAMIAAKKMQKKIHDQLR